MAKKRLNASHNNRKRIGRTDRSQKSASTTFTSVGGSKEKEQDLNEKSALLLQISQKWLDLLLWFIQFTVAGIIPILLGFNPLPQSIPLLAIIQQHSLASLIVCIILLLVTIITLIIRWRSQLVHKDRKSHGQVMRTVRPWIVLTSVTATSMVLCVGLLLSVLLRLSWCPQALCPPPQPLTYVNGVHDTHLDTYPIAVQSTSFVIPNDPLRYAQNNPPESIAAVRLDAKSLSPYRVVVGVHSLQQGSPDIIIERVALMIEQVPPLPHLLNIWNKYSLVNYSANPYGAVYGGQDSGVIIPAIYISPPYGYVELTPGEADQLNVQISSSVVADIRFRVQITYRVADEPQMITLTLPQVFEVVFSDASNWHEYQFQNGRFIPAA